MKVGRAYSLLCYNGPVLAKRSVVHCASEADARSRAAEALAGRIFSAIEVWCRRKKVCRLELPDEAALARPSSRSKEIKDLVAASRRIFAHSSREVPQLIAESQAAIVESWHLLARPYLTIRPAVHLSLSKEPPEKPGQNQ